MQSPSCLQGPNLNCSLWSENCWLFRPCLQLGEAWIHLGTESQSIPRQAKLTHCETTAAKQCWLMGQSFAKWVNLVIFCFFLWELSSCTWCCCNELSYSAVCTTGCRRWPILLYIWSSFARLLYCQFGLSFVLQQILHGFLRPETLILSILVKSSWKLFVTREIFAAAATEPSDNFELSCAQHNSALPAKHWYATNLYFRLWARLFGSREMHILMVGLDAAGKTTILYKLKLGEVLTTIPTIGMPRSTPIFVV